VAGVSEAKEMAMKRRKLLMAGIVAASVAAGAIAGAVIFTPGVGAAASDSSYAEETVLRCEPLLGSGPLAAAADAIGIEPRQLLAELRDGATVAEVAADNGVERSAVVDAVEAAFRERLDAAVEGGWLTQEEADERAEDIREHAEAFVDGEVGPFGFPRPWHDDEWRGPWSGPGRLGGPWHRWGADPGGGSGTTESSR
jgi:hypothetical protein